MVVVEEVVDVERVLVMTFQHHRTSLVDLLDPVVVVLVVLSILHLKLLLEQVIMELHIPVVVVVLVVLMMLAQHLVEKVLFA
jgi:uncharacterized membrane protein YhhN